MHIRVVHSHVLCCFNSQQLAVAEANLIAFTNEQYSAPTDGKPLRGLIQDSVDGGVKMCSRDTFLTKEEFQQLIFQVYHTTISRNSTHR
jgi:DNA-directed RNA polymerase beta' subunit